MAGIKIGPAPSQDAHLPARRRTQAANSLYQGFPAVVGHAYEPQDLSLAQLQGNLVQSAAVQLVEAQNHLARGNQAAVGYSDYALKIVQVQQPPGQCP